MPLCLADCALARIAAMHDEGWCYEVLACLSYAFQTWCSRVGVRFETRIHTTGCRTILNMSVLTHKSSGLDRDYHLLTSCDVGWIHLHSGKGLLRDLILSHNTPHLVIRTTETHRPQEDAHERLTRTWTRYVLLNYSERLFRVLSFRLIHDYGNAAISCHGGRARRQPIYWSRQPELKR